MRYFAMKHSQQEDNRTWALNAPQFVNDRFDLYACSLIEDWDDSVYFSYTHDGPHLDFPCVGGNRHAMSARLQEVVEEVAPSHVQFLPFRIRSSVGTSEVSGYALANYLRRVDCLDRERSAVENDCWEAFNLYGDICLVETVLRKSRIGDAKVFRIVGDSELVVVRQDLQTTIQEAALTGLSFAEIPLS